MSSHRISVGAMLELTRLSNAPTIVTNVLVGCALGSGVGPWKWMHVANVAYAMVLLYAAGMIFNDVCDVEIDRRERPSRPIPSGRVTLRQACGLAGAIAAMALGILAWLGRGPLIAGSILTIVIIAYDLIHARLALSVVLMGLCRGLVYVTAAVTMGASISSFSEPGCAAPAIAMTLYVIVLSIIARREVGSTIGARRGLALLMPLIVVVPVLVLRPMEWTWAIIAGVVVVLWLSLATLHLYAATPRIKPTILGWLAGICLIDAFWLTLLNRPEAAVAAMACFIVTALGHRRIAGT